MISGYFYFTQIHDESKTSIKRETASAGKPESIGVIAKLVGQATVDLRPAAAQQEVFKTQTIQTNNKSFVRLLMKDKSTFNIGPNSIVKLSTYELYEENHREVSIDLIKGALRSHFTKGNQKGYLKVQSKGVVFGVRGTEFITDNDGKHVKMILLEGSVEVTRPDKTSVMVKPKEKIEFSISKIYSKPEAISDEELAQALAEWEIPEVSLNTKSIEANRIPASAAATDANDFFPTNLDPKTLTTDNLTQAITSKNLSYSQKKELIQNSSSPNKKELISKLEKFRDNQNYKNNVATINNPAVFEKLSNQDREAIISKTLSTTQEKAQELIRENKVAVMITPDNKVVFLEEFPKILEQLPRDDKGNILGIKVDENLQPIEQIPLKTSTTLAQIVDTATSNTIPVINQAGEVVLLPLIDRTSETALIIPSTIQGATAGVSLDLVNQAVAGNQSPSLINTLVETVNTTSNTTVNSTTNLVNGLLGNPKPSGTSETSTAEPNPTSGKPSSGGLLKNLFK